MKQYIIDQLFFLVIGIWVMIIIPKMCGYIWFLTILFELMVLLSWGYLCRHVLVFPLDLIFEKKKEEVFFSKISSIDNYEFFMGKFYCEWKFYSSKGSLKLLVPVALAEKEIYNMCKPDVDQKVRVCYYRFSKILHSWEKII